MTKKDITKVIADKYTEFTQKEIAEILDEFLDAIKTANLCFGLCFFNSFLLIFLNPKKPVTKKYKP